MHGVERFLRVLLTLLLGVALHPASGQSPTDSAFSVLKIPVGPPILCQRLDSASLTQLKLEIGNTPGIASRTIQATYDSLGRAHVLVDFGAASGRIEMVTVGFDIAGNVNFGFHRLDSLASLHHTAPATAPRLPSLTSDDKVRAKILTAWIWDHRCQQLRRSARRTHSL